MKGIQVFISIKFLLLSSQLYKILFNSLWMTRDGLDFLHLPLPLDWGSNVHCIPAWWLNLITQCHLQFTLATKLCTRFRVKHKSWVGTVGSVAGCPMLNPIQKPIFWIIYIFGFFGALFDFFFWSICWNLCSLANTCYLVVNIELAPDWKIYSFLSEVGLLELCGKIIIKIYRAFSVILHLRGIADNLGPDYRNFIRIALQSADYLTAPTYFVPG